MMMMEAPTIRPLSTAPAWIRSTLNSSDIRGNISHHSYHGFEDPLSSTSPTTTATPFLEIVVQQLAVVLPSFCRALAESRGSAPETAQACEWLDFSRMNTSSTPSLMPLAQAPASPTPTNTTESVMLMSSSNNNVSPQSHHRLMSHSAPSSPTPRAFPSALAMEGDWDKYVAPCLCWAAAEVWYADCVWLGNINDDDNNNRNRNHSHGATNLLQLFVHIVRDLQLVQEVVCTPCGATHVADWLQRIAGLCRVRAALLAWWTRMVNGSDSTAELLAGLEHVVELIQRETAVDERGDDNDVFQRDGEPTGESSPARLHLPEIQLWKERLLDECQMWKHMVQAKGALEACRFADTILHLRRWKRCLPNNNDQQPLTRLDFWSIQLHRGFLSLLPVYFDRIDAFSGPLYGFDTSVLKRAATSGAAASGSSNTSSAATPSSQQLDDLDDSVLDFLRKQEKAGGPPTAVCLVLDAVSTDNLAVERGFRYPGTIATADNSTGKRNHTFATNNEDSLMTGHDNDSNNRPEDDLQKHWPPIYLRSTIHLAAATSSRTIAGSPYHSSSSSSLLNRKEARSSWTSPTLTDSPKIRSSALSATNNPNNINWTVLEYGPEGHASSFPHTEWEALVALVRADEDNNVFTASSRGANNGNNNINHNNTAAVTTTSNNGSNSTINDNIPRPTTTSSTLTRPSRMSKRPHAVSFLDERETHRREFFSVNEDVSSSLFSIGHSHSSDSVYPDSPPQSSFHVISISEFISMVVIVTAEEESRWHRRRGRLSDDVVREFLDSMARKLRVSSLFSRDRLPDSPRGFAKPLVMVCSSEQTWDEGTLQELLQSIKESFQLRSIPTHDTLRSSLARNSPNLSKNRRLRLRGKQRSKSPSLSAAVLFLGSELAQILDPTAS